MFQKGYSHKTNPYCEYQYVKDTHFESIDRLYFRLNNFRCTGKKCGPNANQYPIACICIILWEWRNFVPQEATSLGPHTSHRTGIRFVESQLWCWRGSGAWQGFALVSTSQWQCLVFLPPGTLSAWCQLVCAWLPCSLALLLLPGPSVPWLPLGCGRGCAWHKV